MFTLATIRFPKSFEDGAMPLSTIAIAGACGAGPTTSPVYGSVSFQSDVMSTESRHMSDFLPVLAVVVVVVVVVPAEPGPLAAVLTGASSVIETMCGTLA